MKGGGGTGAAPTLFAHWANKISQANALNSRPAVGTAAPPALSPFPFPRRARDASSGLMSLVAHQWRSCTSPRLVAGGLRAYLVAWNTCAMSITCAEVSVLAHFCRPNAAPMASTARPDSPLSHPIGTNSRRCATGFARPCLLLVEALRIRTELSAFATSDHDRLMA